MTAQNQGHEDSTEDQRWSHQVNQASSTPELLTGVFEQDDPRAIAHSLKCSAEASTRRKAPPFRSAMSMLVFYLNRTGKQLPQQRIDVLERAKDELRDLYGKPRKLT